MLFHTQDKYQIRHQALLEAIRFCGGVTTFSKLLNVFRTRVSNWLNQSETNIPYEYVLLIEELTQVSIERLSPFTESINKMVRRWQTKGKVRSVEVLIDAITIKEPLYGGVSEEAHSIIIGTDGVLISGLSELRDYESVAKQRVSVTIVDLDSLLLEFRTIEDINIDLLTSERVAIGLRLGKLLRNYQSRRSDFGQQSQIFQKSVESSPSLCRICDKVKSRNDAKIAKLIGFMSKDTYYRAKKVYLQGGVDLISALDRKEISIGMAAKIAKLPMDQQRHLIPKKRTMSIPK